MMTPKDLDLVLRSFDADLNGAEQNRLRNLMSASPQARVELVRLKGMRELVAEGAAESFGPYFADRVMGRVHAFQTKPAASTRLRWTWMGGLITATAAVVVAAVGLFLWSQPVTVQVPYGAVKSVSLSDGSLVELGSGSSLRYRRFQLSNERHVTLEGEAFFDVASGEKPFVVETFNASVEVLGTRFNVRAWPQDPQLETGVAVESGRVRVAPRRPEGLRTMAMESDEIVLSAGEAASIAADTARSYVPAQVSLERILAWRSGGVAFVDQPLGAVFNSIERRFDVRITAPDSVARLRLTYLDPKPASATAVLSDICYTLNLRYRRTAEGYEVVAPP